MATYKTKADLEQDIRQLEEKITALTAKGQPEAPDESLNQLRQRVSEREARAEDLEALIVPFARYDASLKLAENKRLTTCDVGLRVDRLRELVDCALGIKGDGVTE